jgi:hypothetical protein
MRLSTSVFRPHTPPVGLPTMIWVAFCSRATLTMPAAMSASAVVTISAPSSRASAMFLANCSFTAPPGLDSVSTKTATQLACIVKASRRAHRMRCTESRPGVIPTISRCPVFHGPGIFSDRMYSRSCRSTRSAARRRAISRSAVRFPGLKKFSTARAERSGV